MIETHAHIYDPVYKDDRKEMLERAFEAGIQEIWMPNCNAGTIAGMYELEKQYPGKCKSMMGLHPSYVKQNYKEELAVISREFEQRPFFMVGEIGLDFYWDLTYVKEQEEAFLYQLGLAKKFNLPICIHSRSSKDGKLNAIQRCCELIEEFGWKDLRGIFHCFTGNKEDAERVLSLNFLLGIGGIVTFKNGKIDQFLGEISLENLVIETDSPYLAPTPFRGKRNEPAYIEKVVNKLSDIYGKSGEAIIEQTTQNALALIKNKD